jgi:hypothetical protein
MRFGIICRKRDTQRRANDVFSPEPPHRVRACFLSSSACTVVDVLFEVMEGSTKRRRSNSADAAFVDRDGDASAGAPAPHLRQPKRNDCNSSLSASTMPTHADKDYVALVERSAVLLAKLKPKRDQGVATFSLFKTVSEQGEGDPLTVPWALRDFHRAPSPHVPDAILQKGILSLSQDVASTQAAAPLYRRETSVQTNDILSLEEHKELLSGELCAFFTLLHVFFA